MVWPPRYGTAAAGGGGAGEGSQRGPTDEATGSRQAIGALQAQPPDSAAFTPSWVLSPLYVWQAETEPTAAEIKASAIHALLQKPPEIQGIEGDAISLVQAQWPTEGILHELLGLFIYSRPAGSVNWRAVPVFYPFTASAAAAKGTTSYRVNVSTIPTDEYQARTRYLWTRPGVEFASDVLSGAGVPGLVLLRVSELSQPGAASARLSPTQPGATNYYIGDIPANLRERGACGIASGLVGSDQTLFLFQNPIDNQDNDGGGFGTASGLILTRFSYALFTG